MGWGVRVYDRSQRNPRIRQVGRLRLTLTSINIVGHQAVPIKSPERGLIACRALHDATKPMYKQYIFHD